MTQEYRPGKPIVRHITVAKLLRRGIHSARRTDISKVAARFLSIRTENRFCSMERVPFNRELTLLTRD
jgi:hypothetical protein